MSHQAEEEIRVQYQTRYAEDQKKIAAETTKLNLERKQFDELKKRESELFQERLERQIKEERHIIEEKLKAKMQEESAEQVASLQKELNEKSEQVKELNRAKIEVEKLKREKDELKEAVEAESAKKLNEAITSEKEKIKRTEEERNELRIRELQKQLEDQKKLTEEMKRKQDQGSMQLQGEVQELAIEEWLMSQFPLDMIEEIGKGKRGGDCLHVIHTRTRQNCGTIYYESKRTKNFQPAWIEKFKNDMRDSNANIGVLISDVLPADMERMGLREGIWICTYPEFKGLCHVLRESIVQISEAIASQENKGDKMVMLYDYLTSNEFRLQIEAIVEGFTQMKADLESEKRSIQGHWKRREKQIDKVVLNTNFMYNSIKGIAGNAIQSIKLLELAKNNVVDENADED